MKDSGLTHSHLWLAHFAKLVVALTFFLIFVGGHTTTAGAGMAFPDWPLSSGSLNPDGWWGNFFERLEHGHRMTAEAVGLLVGILCAWVWQRPSAVPISFVLGAAVALISKLCGIPPKLYIHAALWTVVVSFLVMLFRGSRGRLYPYPARVRWFAFAAFLGVCVQAVLGGLRVLIESGGNVPVATAFRVFHGCFAQIELCLVVAVAAMVSPVWSQIQPSPQFAKVRRLSLVSCGAVFVQLIVGATMRHFGAGLAIQTFPRATADGRWMPAIHGFATDINFTHTRFGALVVSGLLIWLVVRAFSVSDARVRNVGGLIALLLVVQVSLGISVIWWQRPLLTTTAHVVNGAALLAACVLLAVRTGKGLTGPDEFSSTERKKEFSA